MNGLPQPANGEWTSTPISEAIARLLRVVPLPAPELSNPREATWRGPVERQLEEIRTLGEGWDGFRAGPIRLDVIEFADQVLRQIMRSTTPAPHVTPMSHEGLMLEWHENGINLEIEIEKPGGLWVSFEDAIEGIEEEKPLLSNLRMLVAPIDKLTKRAELKENA